MKTDIEIAQSCPMQDIEKIAEKVGITAQALERYGRVKAKITTAAIAKKAQGKLILVTAINPTPAGEGKTTTTVGLADALCALGKKAVVALREPSLGPVFGIKGGAAGGGYAQVVPMEDINLHFTGDFHAITSANNLLAAMLDNHIHQGNALRIDPRRIVWKRCLDMNDRQLRHVIDGLGLKSDGFPRQDGFEITVASEVMAVLCLANNLQDLKTRLGKMIVAYNEEGEEVTAHDLKAEGAMAVLLKEAMKPNLVQTLEATPCLMHGGPFANIAHGCNSVVATKLALFLGDYVVTEAGFGADLGAEKFLDIKCRKAGLVPSAVVIVATIRALKHQGGASKENVEKENLACLEKGFVNLLQHVRNMKEVYGLPCTVALNVFAGDTPSELTLFQELCAKHNISMQRSEVWQKGSVGGKDLANEVIRLCEEPSNFRFAYADEDTLRDKINKIAQKIYHAQDVSFTTVAERQLSELQKRGYGKYPICMAKTQYSFSDDPQVLGAPENHTLHIRQIKIAAGAGFVIAYCGDILTMPGLPKNPAAENIDIDENGKIVGLF